MFSHGAAVGVAVSGGRDSVCLLHALAELRSANAWRLVVLHVNHRLRPEADDDEAFVVELARSLGCDLRVHRPTLDEGNLEQAAREARRRFFHANVADGICERVATAHTESDQAETLLFRLLRGAGPAGFAAILPVTQEGLGRPLLTVSRDDVARWLTDRGIAWREDATNADSRFARNRIRHSLLPQLEREWNPALSNALARTAAIAAEEEMYWNQAASDLLGRHSWTVDEALVLDVRPMSTQPRAMLRRLIREALRRVRPGLARIDFAHVEQILALITDNEGHGRAIVPGADAMRSFEWLRITPVVSNGDPPPERNWSFPVEPPCQLLLPGRHTVDIYNEDEAKKVGKALILRNWRPGDAIARNGSGISLKQLFQDLRIPLWERRNWPVLSDGDRILWAGEFGWADEIPGLRLRLTTVGVDYRNRLAGLDLPIRVADESN